MTIVGRSSVTSTPWSATATRAIAIVPASNVGAAGVMVNSFRCGAKPMSVTLMKYAPGRRPRI
jgi:hypothetical protein